MDTNTRTYRIAKAADRSLRDGPAVLDEELKGATPEEIAEAYEHAHQSHVTGSAAPRGFLQTRLQVRLMREHVAAQETMARAQDKLAGRIKFLNWILVILTTLLVLLAAPDGVQKVRALWTDWRATSAWEEWARR